jgi:DNA-binding NarL/FixJ family response regulator
MALNLVLLERDPGLAQSLAGGLRPHFSVHVTVSQEQFRDDVVRNRPEAVVLNLELSPLTDIERLHQDFPQMPIVCTHRVPDEEMWMAALSVGACDVCPADDVNNVLSSVLRSTGVSHSAAA